MDLSGLVELRLTDRQQTPAEVDVAPVEGERFPDT